MQVVIHTPRAWYYYHIPPHTKKPRINHHLFIDTHTHHMTTRKNKDTTKPEKPTKKTIGRPPKYKNKRELQVKVNEFFAICDDKKELPEKAGLCIHLGISREIYNRWKKKVAFVDVINAAESRIQSAWVKRLGISAQSAGAIFYLKNAFKDEFKDRHETDITSKGEQIKIYIPERK